MIHERDVNALYKKFVELAVSIMASDAGSMQMFRPGPGGTGELLLLATHGFDEAAQAYWKWVNVDAGSTCAQSLRTRTRTIAEDVASCPYTLRRNDRAAFEAAGIQAAQSTPLFSRDGQLMGMITTHWLRRHRPSDHDLELLDIVARQAADLIERRINEQALRESEERFRAFVATSSDLVYTMSADWSEMLSMQGREFIAHTPSPNRNWLAEYIVPDDHARVLARINEAVAGKTIFESEHRVLRVDGSLGWVHSRAIPLLDEQGEIREWFGTATDITDKKHAQAQQRQALRQSQHAVETLQAAFLPQSLPRLEHFYVDAAYLPAEEGTRVGGDWYDAAQLPDGRILLCVGDVTGHGLSAAVIAGKLRQAAVVGALNMDDPADVLQVLNRVLRFAHPDVYATAMLGFIDAEFSQFTYASAGHPPAFFATVENVTELPCGGVLLGCVAELELKTHRIALPETFSIALYSDGLTEFARDIASAERAIQQLLGQFTAAAPFQNAANAMLQGVLGDRAPSDDVAVLVVQRNRQPLRHVSADPLSEARMSWQFHSNDAESARKVRRTIAELAFSEHLDSDAAFALQTIFGEALANAVAHAPGTIDVSVERRQDDIEMRIRDRGPGLRHKPTTSKGLLEENGRGLFLIQALSADLDIDATESGTELRARVPLRNVL